MMNYKNLIPLFGVLIIGCGLVMAISGAAPTVVSETRWTGQVAGSDTTEGGNITEVNVSSVSLTDRWASYWGNVSGSVVLDDDGTGNAVYIWAVDPLNGGEICVSTNSSFAFAAATSATALQLDTAWAFGAATDNATNTYNSQCGQPLNFTQADVPATTAAANMTQYGASTFLSCAINDGVGTTKTNFAFCTNLQDVASGLNYNGLPANYELMVPTDDAPAATETYYFYLELN